MSATVDGVSDAPTPMITHADTIVTNRHEYIERFRHGSVLGRGTILKADQFSAAHNTKLDVHIVGAPNFRGVPHEVFGASQPTVEGIAGILTMLGSQSREVPTRFGKAKTQSNSAANRTPNLSETNKIIWCCMREEPMVYINGRTYVLRDQDDPMNNIRLYSGIDASRLEQMEQRLKNDILAEASANSQFILVHDEIDAILLPCWIAVKSVRTSQEVYVMLQQEGYNVDYRRVPIAAGQGPEDAFFDIIFDIIWNASSNDRLIFNCQQGRGRTTIGMVIALLVRRARQCQEDPTVSFFLKSAEQRAHDMDNRTHATLRLVHVLEQAFSSKTSPHSAIEWALARGNLIEDLNAAIQGHYSIILQLLRVLDDGGACKALLDQFIDDNDAVINLREAILLFRVQPSNEDTSLNQALTYMERYLCLIAFTAYLQEHLLSDQPFLRFSVWLSQRVEIFTMLHRLRHRRFNLLSIFRPVDDLTALTDKLSDKKNMVRDTACLRERLLVRNRMGAVLGPYTILKLDFWQENSSIELSQTVPFSPTRNTNNNGHNATPFSPIVALDNSQESPMRMANKDEKKRNDKTNGYRIQAVGAPNFRKISGEFGIYGTAQPTLEGLTEVVQYIHQTEKKRVCWVNLREEPLVYINGEPFVLRDAHATLRNIRTISGISGHRLEIMEEKLRDDVRSEMRAHEGNVLVHHESSATHHVAPQWVSVVATQVQTCQDVVHLLQAQQGQYLTYSRIPITAEESLEDGDFDAIFKLITTDPSAAYLFNCQVGAGRSTVGTITAYLILRWLKLDKSFSRTSSFDGSIFNSGGSNSRRDTSPFEPSRKRAAAAEPTQDSIATVSPIPSDPGFSEKAIDEHLDSVTGRGKAGSLQSQYVIILDLLRVLRYGDECRRIVDDAIHQCSQVMHLTKCIDNCRASAQQATDESEQRSIIKKGMVFLKRYFDLICFQGYLNDIAKEHIDDVPTFMVWKSHHLEIIKMQQKFESVDIQHIIPVHEQKPLEGFMWTAELSQVLDRRQGSILAPNTILKSDHFPGSQRLDLHERIVDAPNFRSVCLKEALADAPPVNSGIPHVYGVGMPTKNAVRLILERTKRQHILWICLREEPVIYINGRPYVLRNWQEPLKNLESTGIARSRLENMELRMRNDVSKESERYSDRVLVHTEELAIKHGVLSHSSSSYAVVPVWEDVATKDVQTMKEVFEDIVKEGYDVEYVRVPITDEQAPIPVVFDELLSRVKDIGEDTDVIFNCQLGRGRTTTGMVIVCLVQMIRGGDGSCAALKKSSNATATTPLSSLSSSADAPTNTAMLMEGKYLRGEYKSVLSMLRVLAHGASAKQLVDVAIDACSHLQNLREAIYIFKRMLDTLRQESDTQKYQQSFDWTMNYLYRYLYLIIFAEYLLEENANEFKLPFTHWLRERKEIASLLEDAHKDFEY